jgi:hypothetical protein
MMCDWLFFSAVQPWQAGFDWPIYLAASIRVGHGKQHRKLRITHENQKDKGRMNGRPV